MLQHIKTILWDKEWEFNKAPSYLILFVFLGAVGYTSMELFFHMGNPGAPVGLREFMAIIKGTVSYEAPEIVKLYFPYLWIFLIASCLIFRVTMMIIAYYKSLEIYDNKKFLTEASLYIVSVAAVVVATVLFFRIIGLVFWTLGYGFLSGVNIIEHIVDSVKHFSSTHIPTLINLPYPVALIFLAIGFNLSSLGGYFIHWLTHRSRFLWLTLHRPHHMPEILHPIGIPLAFNFDFLLAFPSLLFNVLMAKLYYQGNLILESTLVLIFFYHFEIFNHLSTHYHIAFHNKFVRFFSEITGNGIYHYMHHTSEEGKEIVNLGGGLFLMWDRLFKTFEQPLSKPPKTGLTNNPKFLKNPLRVTFSGFAQIWYELKHNASWKTKFKILFGEVYYMPPISKEYLITGY